MWDELVKRVGRPAAPGRELRVQAF
jgi:hypothetical protein